MNFRIGSGKVLRRFEPIKKFIQFLFPDGYDTFLFMLYGIGVGRIFNCRFRFLSEK